MANKKSKLGKHSDSQVAPSRKGAKRFRWQWLMIAAVLVVAGTITARLVMKSNSGSRIEGSPASTAASFESTPSGDTAWDSSWPELPQSGKPARPIEVARAAYAYAVRREDVLKYMPCYCGCEKQSHRSNHDCFVRGKTASGAPAWDPMGYT